jgi:hypothetical protein
MHFQDGILIQMLRLFELAAAQETAVLQSTLYL